MNALSAHISAATLNGQIIAGKVNGVVRIKGKGKRMGMQGAAGSNTGSKDAAKATLGNASVGFKARKTVKAQPVLKAGMPKVVTPPVTKPKSKFVLAFEAAKRAQHVQISNESRSRAAGAKATKSPTASSPGAGID